jgi:hypothetical protein
MRLTSISSEVSEAGARARTAPVTVPERVNAIDMAKSPEFTSRQTNRGKGKRFEDFFSSEEPKIAFDIEDLFDACAGSIFTIARAVCSAAYR